MRDHLFELLGSCVPGFMLERGWDTKLPPTWDDVVLRLEMWLEEALVETVESFGDGHGVWVVVVVVPSGFGCLVARFTDFLLSFGSIGLLTRWYGELEGVYRWEVIRERLRGRVVCMWRSRDVGLLVGFVRMCGVRFIEAERERGA